MADEQVVTSLAHDLKTCFEQISDKRITKRKVISFLIIPIFLMLSVESCKVSTTFERRPLFLV